MVTKIYWIHQFENLARLGIMARPRGNGWLEDEIIHLKNNKVDVLVSLLEKEEIHELGLGDEKKYCKWHNITFIHFPIKDRDIPKDEESLENLLYMILLEINAGKSIVVHCRMGIGRASIIATSILLRYKYNINEIIQNIINVRGLKVPDTEEQLHWLKNKYIKD